MPTMEFKTEVKELLHLMIHSLYSHKEIFLRELLSNASDAIDKLRYLSLTDPKLVEGDSEWKIKIRINKDDHSITISDNGVGMNSEDIVKSLGTIAHSGTREFLKTISEKDVTNNPELIGQFGVGFYSSFMVSERVVVISRKAGEAKETAIRWESPADGTYSLENFEKDSRGTDIILFLNEEGKKYLEEWEIKSTVKKYSDFIEHPIYLDLGDPKKENELLNSQKAIWLKERSDVTTEEYKEFYKHVTHQFDDPLKVIHFKAEGNTEFNALLFIPTKAPFDLFYKEYKIGPTLYVKRVQIMDHCEQLIPSYLRFVKGVIESPDLPLNVSREILQANKEIEIIKKSITKKILDTLTELKNHEFDKYASFYLEFSRALKEGLYSDHSRKEALRELILFESTKTEKGKLTSLKEYVDRMKPDQEFIYYMSGATREEIENSPYLESVKEKDFEVLFFMDDIDDFIAQELEYKDKKVKSLTQGELKSDKAQQDAKRDAEKKLSSVIQFMKEHLKSELKDVRVSTRLTDSPCCLVADDEGMDARMERLMKAMGQNMNLPNQRILEVNPNHALVNKLQALIEKDKESAVAREYASVLYDLALLAEGSKIKDTARFSQVVAKALADGIS